MSTAQIEPIAPEPIAGAGRLTAKSFSRPVAAVRPVREAVIDARSVSVFYGHNEAIKSVSLAIPRSPRPVHQMVHEFLMLKLQVGIRRISAVVVLARRTRGA